MLPVDNLWICAMVGPRNAAIERASSMLAHWDRKLEFYNLHVALRLPAGTERCIRWTSFIARLETKVTALRLRRDILVNLEQAADSTSSRSMRTPLNLRPYPQLPSASKP